MKNKIILSADTEFTDEEARKEIIRLTEKVDRINKRTKQHTRYIQELRRKIKELEK